MTHQIKRPAHFDEDYPIIANAFADGTPFANYMAADALVRELGLEPITAIGRASLAIRHMVEVLPDCPEGIQITRAGRRWRFHQPGEEPT